MSLLRSSAIALTLALLCTAGQATELGFLVRVPADPARTAVGFNKGQFDYLENELTFWSGFIEQNEPGTSYEGDDTEFFHYGPQPGVTFGTPPDTVEIVDPYRWEVTGQVYSMVVHWDRPFEFTNFGDQPYQGATFVTTRLSDGQVTRGYREVETFLVPAPGALALLPLGLAALLRLRA